MYNRAVCARSALCLVYVYVSFVSTSCMYHEYDDELPMWISKGDVAVLQTSNLGLCWHDSCRYKVWAGVRVGQCVWSAVCGLAVRCGCMFIQLMSDIASCCSYVTTEKVFVPLFIHACTDMIFQVRKVSVIYCLVQCYTVHTCGAEIK